MYVNDRQSTSRSLERAKNACYERGSFACIDLYGPYEDGSAPATGVLYAIMDGRIYGTSFERIPELAWTAIHPLTLITMLSILLVRWF